MAVAAGVTAFLGLAGAGLAFAAGGGGAPAASLSSTSSTPSSPTTPPKAPHPKMGKVGGPMAGPRPGAGRILHGQYTIDQGGAYKTISVRTGQVTAVSDTSITVQSADQTSQTYTVAPSTIVDAQAGGMSTVRSGDTVRVRALVQGSGNPTATDIVDVTQVGNSRKGFGLVPPGGPTGSGAAHRGPPAPSTAQPDRAPTQIWGTGAGGSGPT